MEKVFRIMCYAFLEAVFMLSMVGGFVIETFLGCKLYGDAYMLRMEAMFNNPLYVGFTVIAVIMVIAALTKYAKPMVDAIVGELDI